MPEYEIVAHDEGIVPHATLSRISGVETFEVKNAKEEFLSTGVYTWFGEDILETAFELNDSDEEIIIGEVSIGLNGVVRDATLYSQYHQDTDGPETLGEDDISKIINFNTE